MLRQATVCLLAILLLVAAEDDKGIFDCLTGPCVTVDGVGKLQGTKKSTEFSGRDYYGFWDIPYGEDTGGANRFQPPKPRGPINDGGDAYDASYAGYILGWWDYVCPQPGLNLGVMNNPFMELMNQEHPMPESRLLGTMGNEDCLRLAVFTPELPTNHHNPKLPVMVYIHGGSFMLGGYVGAGAGKLLEKDMVLVEVQYRLGPLGFMCLPDDEIGGNVGLLDQTLALQWISEHIEAFGGDPNRVTIQGESAGSAAVTYHMLSELSHPYFHQAIAESGSALSPWAFDKEPEKHAKEIASVMDCPSDDLSAMINCLKNEKSAADIVTAHKAYYTEERKNGQLGFGGSVPCAQTHGPQKFITKPPMDIIIDHHANGSPKNIPALFGANKDEGSFVLGSMYNSYLSPNNILEDTFFLKHLFTTTLLSAMGLTDDSGNIYEMLEYSFFNSTDLGTWSKMMDGMVNLVGTFFIKASTYEFMKYNHITGSESYFYSFEYYGDASLWNFLFPSDQPPIPRGVTHGDELLYLFSTGVFRFEEDDWDMAAKMVDAWTNFVIYGNPTPAENMPADIPQWPAYEETNQHYMVLDSQPSLQTNYVRTWANPMRYGF